MDIQVVGCHRRCRMSYKLQTVIRDADCCWPFRELKHRENCKTLPFEHLIGCQCVKDVFNKKNHFFYRQVLSPNKFLSFVLIWFEFCQNWVFEFGHNLSFVTIWVFEFGCNWIFWVWHNLSFELSQFEFLSVVTIGVLEFCHNWSFLVLSKLEFGVRVYCPQAYCRAAIWSYRLPSKIWQHITRVSFVSAFIFVLTRKPGKCL